MAEGSSAREFLKRAADQIRGFSKGFSEARQSISTDNFEAPTDTQEQIMEHGDTRAPAQKDAKGEALEKIHKFAPFKDIRFNIPKIQTGNPNLDQAFNESQSNIIAVLKTSYTEITSKLGFVYSQVQTLDRNIQRVDRQLDTLNIPTKIRDLSDRISQLERKRDNQIKFSDFSNVDRNALSELQKELNELKKRQNDSDSNWKSIAAGGAGAAGAGYGAKKAVDATRGKPRPSTTTKSPQPRDEKGRFMKQGTAAAEEAGESILKRGAKGIGRKLGPLGVAGITGWEFYDQYGQTGSYGEATAGTIGSTFGSMIDMVTPGSSDWNEQFMSHWAKKGYNWLAGDDEEAQEQRGEFNDVDIEKIEIKLTAKERMFLTARKELMLKADTIRLEARDIILDGKVHMPGMYPKDQARLGDDQAQDEGSWWSNAVSALMQGGPMAAGRSLGSSMFGGSRGGGGGTSSVSAPQLSPERQAIKDKFLESGSLTEAQAKELGWIDNNGKWTGPEGFQRSVVAGSNGKQFEYKFNSGVSSMSDTEVAATISKAEIKGGSFKEQAPNVTQKLMDDFGLTKDQALGIVGNLGHESAGLQAGIQEGAPIRGRGGLGWAQWTGPRRVAFEKWAKENGYKVTDPEANYEFLAHELRTSEKKSLEAVKRTNSQEEAMIAFENQFERAGIKNYGSRRKYMRQAEEAYGDGSQFNVDPNTITPEQIAERRAALDKQARSKVDFFRGQEGGYTDVGKANIKKAGTGEGYVFPVTGDLSDGNTSNFGYERGRLHAGVDIYGKNADGQLDAGPSSTVAATKGGRIVASKASTGYGWIVDVKDDNGVVHRYAHIARPYDAEGKPLKVGDTLETGQVFTHITGAGTKFGEMANRLGSEQAAIEHFNKNGWGSVAKPHLHYETRTKENSFRSANVINPSTIFGSAMDKEGKALPMTQGQDIQKYYNPDLEKEDTEPVPLEKRSIVSGHPEANNLPKVDLPVVPPADGVVSDDELLPIEIEQPKNVEINPVEAEFGNPEQGGDINIPELIGNTISGIGDAERLQQQVDQNMANFAYEPVLPMPDISSDVDAAVAEMQTDIASMPEFTAENIAPEYSDVGSLATSPTQDAALLQPDIEPPDIDPAEAPIEDPKSTTPSDEKPDAPNPKAQHGGEKDETGQGQPSKHHSATNKRAYPGDDAQGKHQSNPDGVDLCTV